MCAAQTFALTVASSWGVSAISAHGLVQSYSMIVPRAALRVNMTTRHYFQTATKKTKLAPNSNDYSQALADYGINRQPDQPLKNYSVDVTAGVFDSMQHCNSLQLNVRRHTGYIPMLASMCCSQRLVPMPDIHK